MEQKYFADPGTVQEIQAFVKEFEEGFNKNDAATLATLCTKEAVQVSPEGPICGRQAIEKNIWLSFGNRIRRILFARSIKCIRLATFPGIRRLQVHC